MSLDHHFAEPTAIRTNLGAIFVSLELIPRVIAADRREPSRAFRWR